MQSPISTFDAPQLQSTATPSKGSRYARITARSLLGFTFCFAGSNGIFQFLPQRADGMPHAALELATAFAHSGYMMPFLGAAQALAGVLLLVNRCVPLGLVILAPIVLNIVAFHLFLAPQGLVVAGVVLALELYLAYANRKAFTSLFTKSA